MFDGQTIKWGDLKVLKSFIISALGIAGNSVEVTTTTYQLQTNTRHVINTATLCTLTLPATIPFGSTITVDGKGVGLWKIAQNAGQTIHSTADTTTGVTGSLTASARYDNVVLVCIAANTDLEATARNGSLVLA